MIVIHLEVNENILDKKTLWKKNRFSVCSKATCFSYYDCVPSGEAARTGSVSVFNGEREASPHVSWRRNAIPGRPAHLCDIRPEPPAPQAAGGAEGAGRAELPESTVLVRALPNSAYFA